MQVLVQVLVAGRTVSPSFFGGLLIELCSQKDCPSPFSSNQKEILGSLLGRLPTKRLEVCKPAAAFVPLGIYSLLFLLLTSHPVATMALPSLCSCLGG